MLITRKSALTRIEHQREIDVTDDQLRAWVGGTPIQRVMPHLSDDDREFIMSGITPEEWAAAFPPEANDQTDEAYE